MTMGAKVLSQAFLLLAMLAVDPALAAGDEEKAIPDVLAAAREVIASARFCTLITLDSSGHPRARVMDPFPPEDDLSIWMATNRSTRKVQQIATDPRATLSCFDAEAVAYVSLLGVAEIIDDLSERERRFKPEWSAFYDDQYRGDDYLLIHLVPYRVEIVSHAHGIASGPMAWKPRIVELPVEP